MGYGGTRNGRGGTLVEALHAGTNSDDTRESARIALEFTGARLAARRTEWLNIVMVCSLDDPWKCKLFLELCRRYGLKPYREKGQRSSTVQALAPRKFHHKTLWPEYLALTEELEKHLADRTDRVIREAIHTDVSEAAEGLRRAFPSPSRDSDSSGRCGGRRRDHWRAGPRDVVLRQQRREVLLASE